MKKKRSKVTGGPVAKAIVSVLRRSPDTPYREVAERVRSAIRGAHTTPKSVAATVHHARHDGAL